MTIQLIFIHFLFSNYRESVFPFAPATPTYKPVLRARSCTAWNTSDGQDLLRRRWFEQHDLHRNWSRRARTVIVNMQPTVVGEVRTGTCRQLFHSEQRIGKQIEKYKAAEEEKFALSKSLWTVHTRLHRWLSLNRVILAQWTPIWIEFHDMYPYGKKYFRRFLFGNVRSCVF